MCQMMCINEVDGKEKNNGRGDSRGDLCVLDSEVFQQESSEDMIRMA